MKNVHHFFPRNAAVACETRKLIFGISRTKKHKYGLLLRDMKLETPRNLFLINDINLWVGICARYDIHSKVRLNREVTLAADAVTITISFWTTGQRVKMCPGKNQYKYHSKYQNLTHLHLWIFEIPCENLISHFVIGNKSYYISQDFTQITSLAISVFENT